MRASIIGTLSTAAVLLLALAFWPDGPAGAGLKPLKTALAQGQNTTPIEAQAITPARNEEEAEIEQVHAEIRDKLKQRIDVDYQNIPLNEVVAELGEKLTTPLVIDQLGLEEAGVPQDQPVSIKLTGVSGKSVLRLLLEKFGLGYTIRDEVVMITTKEHANEAKILRVYNCRDLLNMVPQIPASMLIQGGYGGLPVVGGAGGNAGPAAANAGSEELVLNGPALTTVIEQSVEPNSWANAGGNGTITDYSGLIVISQNEQVHSKVEKLLAMLREAAEKPMATVK